MELWDAGLHLVEPDRFAPLRAKYTDPNAPGVSWTYRETAALHALRGLRGGRWTHANGQVLSELLPVAIGALEHRVADVRSGLDAAPRTRRWSTARRGVSLLTAHARGMAETMEDPFVPEPLRERFRVAAGELVRLAAPLIPARAALLERALAATPGRVRHQNGR